MPGPLYFFGCWSEAGHFLHDTSGATIYRSQRERLRIPVNDNVLDATFAPPFVNQQQNLTAITYIHGWTVLAMWDRSVDTRPGCNAAFLTDGQWTENEMWERIATEYPKIVRRLVAYHEWKAAREKAVQEFTQRSTLPFNGG